MPSRLLAVSDVSDSMGLRVPGRNRRARMDLAREAAVRGLALSRRATKNASITSWSASAVPSSSDAWRCRA